MIPPRCSWALPTAARPHTHPVPLSCPLAPCSAKLLLSSRVEAFQAFERLWVQRRQATALQTKFKTCSAKLNFFPSKVEIVLQIQVMPSGKITLRHSLTVSQTQVSPSLKLQLCQGTVSCGNTVRPGRPEH